LKRRADQFALEPELARLRRQQEQRLSVQPGQGQGPAQSIAQPQLLAFTQIYEASLAEIGVKLNIKNLEQANWPDFLINKKKPTTLAYGLE
jgi:hypothetical protein